MCAEISTIDLPAPPLTPDSSTPTVADPDVPPGTSRRFWMVVGVAFACVLLLAVVLYRGRKPATDPTATAMVERTQFVSVLRLKGTTAAVQSRMIAAPLMSGSQLTTITITRLAGPGAKVKRGDLLVEFDRQLQVKDALDKQASYQKFASQAAESQAQEDAARAKDETELKTAEDEEKKDDLEMRRNEILSRIDAEKNQEKLDEAKANLLQLRQTFELKRRSAKAAIRMLELQRDKAHDDMEHAQANADRMQIRAPIDGVVALQTIFKQGTIGEVKEGDQVRPGMSLMNIVDPSAMQVTVQANQQDIAELQVGHAAKIWLDAYPEIAFQGKLQELAPLGMQGSFSQQVHLFTAIFSVDGSNAKLMPDLSAAVDVELERHNDVLVAPRESIVGDGKNEFAWVKNGLGFHKQQVTTGAQSDTQVVILSGLAAGDLLERNPASNQTESD